MRALKRVLAVLLVLGVFAGAVFGALWIKKTADASSLRNVLVEPAPPQERVPEAQEPPDARLEGLTTRTDGARLLYAPSEGVMLVSAAFIDNETMILTTSEMKGRDPLWRISRLDLKTRRLATLSEGRTPRRTSPHRPAHPNAGRFCYAEQDPPRGVFEVWCADLDGKNPKQVTTHDGREDLGAASISPDGSWIAFEVVADKPKPQGATIWKIRLNGADLQQLTRGADDRAPTWSDDGARIYFQRKPLVVPATRASVKGLREATWDMYGMDADGKNSGPLLRTNEEDELFPTRRTATDEFVIVESASGTTSRLKMVDSVTKKGEYLTDGSSGAETAPSTSPDGALASFIAPSAVDRPSALGLWLVQLGS